MFPRLKNLFVTRTDDDVIAEAEASAPVVGRTLLRQRHQDLLARGQAVGLDPATVLLLIELFGGIIVKLVERYIKRHGG